MSDFQDFNRALIAEFRANDGKVSGQFEGAHLLLLTSTGAKSGREHTTPVVYTNEGDGLVVIASKGGAPTNPAWYHNLVAHPSATVELGAETFAVTARVAEGDERDRLFDAQAALMPNFKQYQEGTSRRIPVIVLERVA